MIRLCTRSIRWLVLLPCILSISPAFAETQLAGRELVEALRGGGFNIYFRHAATDWRQDDYALEPDDLSSCDPDRMRQLSDRGRETARAVGEAIRALGVPVGRVLSSPYCRCVEMGRLMEIGPVRPTTDIMNTRSAGMFGGLEAVAERAKRVLATAPDAGTNTVVIAHGNLMRAAGSVSLPEGGAAVMRPDGSDDLETVAQLTSSDWQRLADEFARQSSRKRQPAKDG